ncbi:MAG TPA: ribonuclease R [Xanthobacteraceae bacterium]|nr:ribonuclease R [Xanthobacteraceae bacterium]
MKPPRGTSGSLPSKEDILAFIAAQPGKVGTREIAREFGLKNADRAALRAILRELADEERIEGNKHKLHPVGALPSVVLADITARDRDGEFLATPTEWDEETQGPAPKIRIRTPRKAKPGEAGGVGDRALVRLDNPHPGDETGLRSGRVIKVLDRARRRILGIYRALPNGAARLLPIDKKEIGRELAIPLGMGGDAQDGDLVSVEVTNRRGFGLAVARVAERLGSLSSEKAVSLIAINAHGIPHVFPAAVTREAEAARPADMAHREDWRALPLVTIDPPDAKDHDDAVHAAADTDPANKGGFIITVAIADVAYFVRPGGALDREALLRGNSVYFPDRVVPMLPERISNDLCSLRPDEDRAALAVRMIVTAEGRKIRHSFHRIMMRSHARLAYAQAQAAVDGMTDEITAPLLDDVLKPLYAAYDALKIARAARHPLDLDLPERKILLKADGTVDRVVMPERLDAHRLIEEYMILANVAAAETLERKRTPLIYRVHDEPSPEKLENLRVFLGTIGIALPKGGITRPEQFNHILARVKGRDVEHVVNEVVLRSQAQAEYAAENYGHYGLNLRRYAHFTSPIRRYADLIVHRALISAENLGAGGLPPGTDVMALNEIGATISAAERRAMKAERETNDRLIAHFLGDRIGARFEGRIAGVTSAGLFVKLDGTGADGFIPARTIGNDYYRYREDAHATVGERTGESYRLGDAVTVRLVEAVPVAGALRFEILSEGRYDIGRTSGSVRRSGKVTLRDAAGGADRTAGDGAGKKAGARKKAGMRKAMAKKSRAGARKAGPSKVGKGKPPKGKAPMA